MSTFDLFQRATCEIAEGDHASAAKTLDKAIKLIDKKGVDREMRDDLVALRQVVAA